MVSDAWSIDNRAILEKMFGRELSGRDQKVTLKVGDIAKMMDAARKEEVRKKTEPKSEWQDMIDALKSVTRK